MGTNAKTSSDRWRRKPAMPDNKTTDRWQPIETAPRDGASIDIWVVPPTRPRSNDRYVSKGAVPHRVADARPAYALAWQRDGRCVTGRWFAEGLDDYYDPDDVSDASWRATHWRRPPEGPEMGASDNAQS